MRFWDSSPLVGFLIEEPWSKACRDLYRADRGIAAWTFARHETWSALCRRRREGTLSEPELDDLRARLDRFADRWLEIPDGPRVRTEVDRLLRAHDLRTADALQLAAALVLADGRPKGHMFVSGDEKLLKAAGAEGFAVVRPE